MQIKNTPIMRLLSTAIALFAPFGVMAQFTVTSLTVEHMKNPTTVEETSPRLSWVNEVADAKVRGERQTAYRIVVASSAEKLEAGEYDLWDSGRVLAEQSTLVPYGGRRLKSGQDCYWKVQTWNAKGKPSAWSETGYWGMGLLRAADWKAQWISAGQEQGAPLFRKAFTLKNGIRQAKAYVSAGGYFELYMNGKRVGDDYLVPNFTNYTVRKDLDKGGLALEAKFSGYRVLYLAYDVTQMLQSGRNAAGAILGDGFYRCSSHWVRSFGEPCLLVQIEVTYADGSRETIGTDASWLTKPSAITMTGVYDGEAYDARQETPKWAEADCEETGWKPARLAEAPIGKLTAHTSPTDKICEVLKPVSLTRNEKGEYEVDFGKEISGWIRIKDMRGKAGQKMSVKYISESPLGREEYTFSGQGPESYAPRFTWYVFSKAVISGLGELKADQLQAEAVNTDVPVCAEFHTSNELFNTINQIWQRSQLDNMHGCIASDCPHRERSPYTGDGQIAAATVMLNFDAAAFYRKWIRDMRDAQNPESGYVPNGAPWQPGCGGGVAWGAAMNVIPWEYYMQYGDVDELQRNYRPMKEQVRHMLNWLTPEGTMFQQKKNAQTGELCYWFNLGDWTPPYEMPRDETVHTFYLWLCAENTALAARTLGHADEYNKYHEIAEKAKAAYHKKFYDEQKKTYGDFGPNVLALWMGVPSERRADVVNALRHEIMDLHDGHIHTGFVTTKFLLETLSDNGLHDVAMTLMNKTDFPSFGNWIRQGATTTWEQWNGRDSRNHPMYGGCLTWFPRHLAGIRVTREGAGYRHFDVRPVPAEGLDSVYYSLRTPQGQVSSRVLSSGGRLQRLEVTVPVGSTATVFLPADSKAVRESGKKLRAGKGIIRVTEAEDGKVKAEVGQGKYDFTVE